MLAIAVEAVALLVFFLFQWEEAEVGAVAAAVEDFPVADFREAEAVPGEEARAEAGDMKTKNFISNLDEKKIVNAIAEAEKKTSGEIRVYISDKNRDDALTAAKNRFEKLGMTKTKLRNGVLIYIAPVSQKFAIVGDSGIHQKCGEDFWKVITDGMGNLFKEGRFTDALVQAIGEVGAALAKHFPHQGDDSNELPNEILRD